MGTDWFFGHHIEPLSLGGKSLMLVLGVVCGGLIGFERQWHGNAAGMRTHIMVCVGSALVTMTSVEIGLGVRGGMRGDPGHIAAQIVSGIGFLGAGAILREGPTIKGLTTASSIWVTAGIGIALGASPRLAEIALIATGIVLVTLALLTRVEMLLHVRRGIQELVVEVQEADRGAARVLDLLKQEGIVVYGVQSEAGPGSLNKEIPGATRQMRMRVLLPQGFQRTAFNTRLLEESGVVGFHMA